MDAENLKTCIVRSPDADAAPIATSYWTATEARDIAMSLLGFADEVDTWIARAQKSALAALAHAFKERQP